MQYIAIADTDIGTTKQINQDSVLIKHGICREDEVLLCVVCDGMGGHKKGELASATVVREFSKWFDEELPFELEKVDIGVIGEKLASLLKELNVKIAEYGQNINISIGTTCTGALFLGEEYVAVHVGDSRMYSLDSGLRQLTTDHSVVAQKIRDGVITLEQARTDEDRNKLQQCIGASEKIEPEILTGRVTAEVYMLCTDGFIHEISEDEIYEALKPYELIDSDMMHSRVKILIEKVKDSQEKDNISVVLIKAR